MLLQLGAVLLGLIGLIFRNDVWAIGGLLAILIDVYGWRSGRGDIKLPLALYVVGGAISGFAGGRVFTGVLVGAIVGQAIEVVSTLFPPAGLAVAAALAPVTFLSMRLLALVFPRARVPLQELPFACTGCGAKGYTQYALSRNQPAAFELRGQLQGASVLRCTSCGRGLLVSISHGFAFGMPKLIPDDPWRSMCAYWDANHPAGDP